MWKSVHLIRWRKDGRTNMTTMVVLGDDKDDVRVVELGRHLDSDISDKLFPLSTLKYQMRCLMIRCFHFQVSIIIRGQH